VCTDFREMTPIRERSGVLVVRAWIECATPEGLRVRITQILGPAEEPTEATAATVDETLALVRSWLEYLMADPQTREP
jgi:hypothetical protein